MLVLYVSVVPRPFLSCSIFLRWLLHDDDRNTNNNPIFYFAFRRASSGGNRHAHGDAKVCLTVSFGCTARGFDVNAYTRIAKRERLRAHFFALSTL